MGAYLVALMGILLLFLNGCLRIPKDDASCQLLPTPELDETVCEALENSIFTTGDFPQRAWWETFENPQLSDLIQTALFNSPTIKKAEAVLRTAEEEAIVQRARLFPYIGFSATFNWEHYSRNSFFLAFAPQIPSNITETNLGLNFSYELDFWGKNRNLFEAKLGIEKAKRAEKAQAELILSVAVAASYYKLQWYLVGLDILKRERSILTRLLELTNMRKSHAIDSELDLLASEQLLLAINQNVEMYQQNVSIEEHALKMLLGFGPDADLEICPMDWDSFSTFPLPENISCNLLAHRPDLMALIWQVESAAHVVGAAKADFYPSVDLVAFAGFDSVFFRKLFNWKGSRQDFLTPALNLPIFTAGRIRANLRAKYAEFEQAIDSYNERLLQAVQQVADQIVVLKTADEKLNQQIHITQNQQHLEHLATLKFNNALNNELEVLQVRLQTQMQMWTRYQMEYERIYAAVSLIQVLGGGYGSE